MYALLFTLHLLGASVWTGGHLVLALSVLPSALRRRSVGHLQAFEAAYERVGVPALVIQVVTGLLLAARFLPPSAWLGWDNPYSRLVTLKLGLLLLTVLLALDARLRLIPKLDERRLVALALHVVPVTLIAVGFVLVGAGLRLGWLS